MKLKKGDWILIYEDDRFTLCKVDEFNAEADEIWGPWTLWQKTIGECIKRMDELQYISRGDCFSYASEREITVLPKNRKKREEFLIQEAVLRAL